MTCNEELGYVMLGYEKAIVSLMHLDYKSETIQILISLIYQLQCDDFDSKSFDHKDVVARNFFAENHSKAMLNRADDYIEMFGEVEFEYLLHAVTYFSNNI